MFQGNRRSQQTFFSTFQERNERLFYKLLIHNVEELLPIVYTPVVGEACRKYGSIFRRPQVDNICISVDNSDNYTNFRCINLSLYLRAMEIPVGKLALYAALGGVCPSLCLLITIDVGTNNQKLLDDEFIIGLKQKSETGQGTSSVVLAGHIVSLKLVGGTLANHTFLFLGAGEGTPVADVASDVLVAT
ncbi:hypothetical protein AgCh_038877 [Apium graveolens]